jgi:hypothetical protein
LIRKFSKKINSNFCLEISLKKYLSRCVILLLFFSFSSSCSDQGCIEADDFGEYQQQTLVVSSNNNEGSCYYDSTLDLIDSSQGQGIKTCLTSGVITVTDEAGDSETTTSGGCSGNKSDGTALSSSFKTLCIQNCIASCQSGTGGPNWIATDQKSGSQNSGVTILPGAKINITAKGTVILSDNVTYQEAFISSNTKPSDAITNYNDKNWTTPFILDAKSDQILNVKFSGMIKRPKCTSGGTWNGSTCLTGIVLPNYNNEFIGGGATAATVGSYNSSINNGARALVAYLIPHPDGYSFDSTQTTEVLGTKGTPILPDPRTWSCDYDANKVYDTSDDTTRYNTLPNYLESTCYVKTTGYATLGYAASVDSAVAANSSFAITSAAQ